MEFIGPDDFVGKPGNVFRGGISKVEFNSLSHV